MKRVLLILAGLLLLHMAHAASFDCARATAEVEKLICSDPQLSKRDEALSSAYSKAVKDASDPAAVKKQQREWLADVRKRCGEVNCLMDAYAARISQLRASTSASALGHIATSEAPASAQYPHVIYLGNGGGLRTEIAGISGDGSVVVGAIVVSEDRFGTVSHPFRWTRKDGFEVLGEDEDQETAGAHLASADGSVIVGNDDAGAFRWTRRGDRQAVTAGIANGMSADGSVIVGEIGPPEKSEVYRWTQANGVQVLGSMGGKSVMVGGLSADGSVIVGTITFADGSAHAFRWTQGGGVQDLGAMGGKFSAAHCVSADGSVIVGEVGMASGVHIFRWSKTDGAKDLGAMDGVSTYPSAVSDDGSIIIGSVRPSRGGSHAFRWTQSGGMQDLGKLGGTYVTVTGASADASIIVGTNVVGNNVSSFVAPLDKRGLVKTK